MIRKANNKDIKIIYSLLLEGVSNGKVLNRTKVEIKKALGNFFIFEQDGVIVGCCSLEIYSQKIAEILSLVVTLKYRNRGIGSMLIKKCLEEAKRQHIYQVLSVTDKYNLFERYGFRTEFSEKKAMFLNVNKK